MDYPLGTRLLILAGDSTASLEDLARATQAQSVRLLPYGPLSPIAFFEFINCVRGALSYVHPGRSRKAKAFTVSGAQSSSLRLSIDDPCFICALTWTQELHDRLKTEVGLHNLIIQLWRDIESIEEVRDGLAGLNLPHDGLASDLWSDLDRILTMKESIGHSLFTRSMEELPRLLLPTW